MQTVHEQQARHNSQESQADESPAATSRIHTREQLEQIFGTFSLIRLSVATPLFRSAGIVARRVLDVISAVVWAAFGAPEKGLVYTCKASKSPELRNETIRVPMYF